MRTSWLDKAPPETRAEFVRLRSEEGRSTDALHRWTQERGLRVSRAGVARALRKVDRQVAKAQDAAATAAALAARGGTADDRALSVTVAALAAAVADAARGLDRREPPGVAELALLAKATRDLASARALLPGPPAEPKPEPRRLDAETLKYIRETIFGV